MIHDLSDCRRSMVDGQYSLEVGTGLWILTYSGQRSAACPEAQRGIGGRRAAGSGQRWPRAIEDIL